MIFVGRLVVQLIAFKIHYYLYCYFLACFSWPFFIIVIAFITFVRSKESSIKPCFKVNLQLNSIKYYQNYQYFKLNSNWLIMIQIIIIIPSFIVIFKASFVIIIIATFVDLTFKVGQFQDLVIVSSFLEDYFNLIGPDSSCLGSYLASQVDLEIIGLMQDSCLIFKNQLIVRVQLLKLVYCQLFDLELLLMVILEALDELVFKQKDVLLYQLFRLFTQYIQYRQHLIHLIHFLISLCFFMIFFYWFLHFHTYFFQILDFL